MGTHNRDALAQFLRQFHPDAVPVTATPTQQPVTGDIAVIGMHAQFPNSPTLATFWDNLTAEQSLVGPIPANRRSDTGNSHVIGALDDPFSFDSGLFGIAPREAAAMDPHQRVLLETVWAAIENAGYAPTALSGTKTGVFVAMYNTDFLEYSRAANWEQQSQVYLATGGNQAIVSNRISYLLDLHGPSEIISTACSSALVALHKGVQAIHAGDCELALVGGVSLLLSPDRLQALSKLGILSAAGYCAPFDKDSPGEVMGEGVGVVLLKPLAAAQRDGDIIQAVLKATGTNHHGSTSGSMTMPSVEAQAELIVDTYRHANISPDSISYIEAHGSGNVGGDMVELMAFKKAFQTLKGALRPQTIGVGSGKGNTGFLEAAGGMAQLMKVILSLQHHTLPATLHFSALADSVDRPDNPFYVVAQTQRWNGTGQPRRAALNAYGLGGTNAHIVVEEYVAPTAAPSEIISPQLIMLSANTQEGLQQQVKALADYLAAQPPLTPAQLQSVAYTLQVGRAALRHRLIFAVDDAATLHDKLAAILAGQKVDRAYQGKVKRQTAAPADLSKSLRARKLKKLAKAWIQGVAIDWTQLYGDTPPRRVSLPTYPFARNAYPLPNITTMPAPSAPVTSTPARLHPLIYENVSDLRGLRYQSVFTGAEPFLQDHQVNGEKFLPGVIMLEMAQAAGELAGSQAVAGLRDVVWTQPIKIGLNSGLVLVSLQPVNATEATFQIQTGLDATVHSQGRIAFRGTAQPAPLFLPDLEARCPTTMAASECYRQFAAQGIAYGPTFQTIQSIAHNNTEALARLCGSASGLIDGALQAIIALNRTNAVAHLPYAVQAVDFYGPLPQYAYAYICRTAADEIGATYDVLITDEQGRVLLAITAFGTRPLRSPAPVQHPVPASAPASDPSPVAQYYDNYSHTATLEGIHETYLNYVPFPAVLPGFSWVRMLSEQETDPAIRQLVRDKHRELRNVLFRVVDFARVYQAQDIGCGYGSDMVWFAKTYLHITVHGYTISQGQADWCRRKIASHGLQDRAHVYHRDSTRDPFPARCDLIYGVEVAVHIKDKHALFANIAARLAPDGWVVLADFTSNIRTEIDLDDIGTFTITKEQWLDLFDTYNLELVTCVNVSADMANSLYDPRFETNQEGGSHRRRVMKRYQEMDNNLHLSLKKELVSYILMTLRPATNPATRHAHNRALLLAPTPYRQVINEHPHLGVDSQGFFTGRQATPQTHVLPTRSPNIRAIIQQEIQEVLGYDAAEIDASLTFEELGVTSINAVEIVGALNHRLDIYLKTTQLFNHPNIDALARFIQAEYSPNLGVVASAPSVTANSFIPDLDQMSLEDLEALSRSLGETSHG